MPFDALLFFFGIENTHSRAIEVNFPRQKTIVEPGDITWFFKLTANQPFNLKIEEEGQTNAFGVRQFYQQIGNPSINPEACKSVIYSATGQKLRTEAMDDDNSKTSIKSSPSTTTNRRNATVPQTCRTCQGSGQISQRSDFCWTCKGAKFDKCKSCFGTGTESHYDFKLKEKSSKPAQVAVARKARLVENALLQRF